jgi:hypothetical protein
MTGVCFNSVSVSPESFASVPPPCLPNEVKVNPAVPAAMTGAGAGLVLQLKRSAISRRMAQRGRGGGNHL